MKKIGIGIGILLMMAAAAACGSAAPLNNNPSTEPPAAQTTEMAAAAEETAAITEEITITEESTAPETTVENADTDAISGYTELLDWYYQQISEGWSHYDKDMGDYGPVTGNRPTSETERSVSYLWYFFEKPDITKAGYQVLDINQDGVNELIVGVTSDCDDSATPYDLYTLYDGKPVRLVSAGERTAFSVGNGVIADGGSAGAATHISILYHLKDGKMEPFEEYTYDGMKDEENPYFYSNEPFIAEWGGYDFQNRTHITEEEFEHAFDKYEMYDVQLQLFSDYKPA